MTSRFPALTPVFALMTLAVCALADSAPVASAPSKEPHLPMALTDSQRQRLRQALEPLDAQYDSGEKMLRRPFSSPGYHTALKGGTVHPTRESLAYAVALLDTGEPQREKRAEDILRRVIALQDQDPASKTYGIWSWFLEEPLAKMSPPDWNWADFLGVQLLQVALYHRDRLPADLAKAVDDSIRHAANSIRKRNVGPGYTNIAIMGTYVTLVAAETYGDEDLKRYAMERLRRFHEYSRHHGAFTEYNSPTYTIVALKELGRLRQHARDPEAKRLAEDIYRMAWEEIAHHFHAPTRQWAGPHSRAYSDLLGKDTLALIQRSTSGRVDFGLSDTRPSADEHRLQTPCPPDLEPYFVSLEQPRELVKTFVRDEKAPVVGTTYLAPAFALGTINRGDLWNQRRPLIAHFGSAERPSYLRLRFLHDGYDFAAARFWGRQKGGRVLAAVNIATDGGDRHPSLDRIKNATIRAKDLRLRFEFGGAAAAAELEAPESLDRPVSLKRDGLHIGIAVPYARFGEGTGRCEAGRDEKTAFLDVVLYEGEERTFRLAELNEARAGLALLLSEKEEALPAVAVSASGGRLKMDWNDLGLDIPLHPDTTAALGEKAGREPAR